MATMVPGRKPRQKESKESKGIPALTKNEVIQITAAEAELSPFQDEKLEIYCREHDDIAASFAAAREGRGVLAKLYDQRNKEILDRLVAMRAKSDREAKLNLDQLKDFCKEFVDTVAERKRAWKQNFADDKSELTTRSTKMGETITTLDAAIVQEHEDCLAHAAAETEPLLAALSKHKEFLAEQVAERSEEHDRFMGDMQSRFHSLRRRLAEEREARRHKGHEMRQRAEDRFSSLDSRIKQKEPEVLRHLEDVRARMSMELQMRSTSQESMVQDMMRFMAHFEKSISESGERQEKTKAHLHAMKMKLREEE
ncbi:hypothetical protein AK812_SmicGene9619 [Symbiodinium microadriaticum]|uniref:Uncharacterized protein n=1 Tax=Symbiodinium microadriaticum TaxID=2951 RepID=A0A1Q9EHU7_SYMMI|nr:hypothetical protein AK812_SmicGene9619 [Symbiodinium microadriaticum]CAE7575834.1 unnamed protein product [Symbiodinium sp. KB8]CAE7666457.1 unnamed protein product [Symbiodinium microadriaticum]